MIVLFESVAALYTICIKGLKGLDFWWEKKDRVKITLDYLKINDNDK